MSPQPPLGWDPPVPGACAPCWAGRPRSPAPAHPAGLGAHSPLRLRTPTRGGPSRPGDCLLTQPQGPRVDVHGGAAQGCRPGRTSPWGKGGKAPPQPPCPSPSRPMGELRPAARFWVLGPSTCPVPGSHRRASMPMTLAAGVYWKLKLGKPAAATDAGRIRTPSGGVPPGRDSRGPGGPPPASSAPGTWPVPVHPVTAVRPPGPPAPACCALLAEGAPTTLSRVRGAPPPPPSSQRLLRHRLSLSRRRCPRAPLLATELKWAPKGGAEEWARAGSLMRPRRGSEPAGGAVRVREWRRRPAGMRPPAGPCGPLSSLSPAPRYSAWS